MARIEKTVFISYRRTDVYTALAVYENLKNQGYDVFFDYRSISSGDFEQIITSNIRARAHFLIILTPTALDRLNEPGDWLGCEIEIAIEEKRNIVPLFFKGFSFGTTSVSDKLTGKLKTLSRYNGLNVHEDYFDEAMHRLREQYLSKPLDTVLHPVSTEVQKVVKAEQVAADKALEKIESARELVKQKDANAKPPRTTVEKLSVPVGDKEEKPKRAPARPIPYRLIAVAGFAGGLALLVLCVWGGVGLWNNLSSAKTGSTQIIQPTETKNFNPSKTSTASPSKTSIPPTSTMSPMTGKDGMILLYVPAGEFTMGSENGYDDEKPVHTVYLDAFWIDQTEVTNAMFSKFANEMGYTTDAEKAGKSWVHQGGVWKQINGTDWSHPLGPSSGVSNIMNHPVVHVSWNDAQAYCSWVDRRLPTEAEWEKAARGTDGHTYPWGNDSPNNNLLNYYYAVGNTTEVGKYPNGASPYGALDMAGNVWEWVNDWLDAYPGNMVSNSDYGTKYRVLRGGAWNDYDIDLRSANRYRFSPADTYSHLGFRCAMGTTP